MEHSTEKSANDFALGALLSSTMNTTQMGGGGGDVVYEDDSLSLPYFISTRETGFQTSLLQRFDIKILIGQLSYKQRSDRYDEAKKTLRTTAAPVECLPHKR